jgi:chemotaxis protein methyltransferase CheR
MPITAAEFEYVRTMVRERSAIVLDAGKEYLVESRLIPVARRQGHASVSEFIARMRAGSYNGLHRTAVEAMTTNETSFFRDLHPFDALRSTIIPGLIQSRADQKRLNIWCAASSSGQEPVTIALLLREHFPKLTDWIVQIHATDLAGHVLERARAGRYTQLEVNRGLPATYLVKHFSKEGVEWKLKDDVLKMIDYKEMNLAAAWPTLPPYDIIFIRNVLIYFDIEMKKAILAKIRKALRPDGYLFLGSAETTTNLDESYMRAQIDKSNCYRRKGAS